jgi:hypothetical protein
MDGSYVRYGNDMNWLDRHTNGLHMAFFLAASRSDRWSRGTGRRLDGDLEPSPTRTLSSMHQARVRCRLRTTRVRVRARLSTARFVNMTMVDGRDPRGYYYKRCPPGMGHVRVPNARKRAPSWFPTAGLGRIGGIGSNWGVLSPGGGAGGPHRRARASGTGTLEWITARLAACYVQ